jgi:hypothetical protein
VRIAENLLAFINIFILSKPNRIYMHILSNLVVRVLYLRTEVA